VLDHYGLERALEWYTEQFERQTGLDTTFTKEGSGSGISDAVAIQVYRILQESLNNVRASESTTAFRASAVPPRPLRLKVQDAGRGCRNGPQDKERAGGNAPKGGNAPRNHSF